MIEKNKQRKERKAAASAAASAVSNATRKSNVNFMWRKVETRGIVPNARKGIPWLPSKTSCCSSVGVTLTRSASMTYIYMLSTHQPLGSTNHRRRPSDSEQEGHTATVVGTVMYVYGGSSELGYLRDVFSLNLASNGEIRGEEIHFQWGYPEISGETPAARRPCGPFGQRIYYFGGYTEQGYSNQLVVLDTNNMAWEYPAITGVKPAPREGHVVVK